MQIKNINFPENLIHIEINVDSLLKFKVLLNDENFYVICTKFEELKVVLLYDYFSLELYKEKLNLTFTENGRIIKESIDIDILGDRFFQMSLMKNYSSLTYENIKFIKMIYKNLSEG